MENYQEIKSRQRDELNSLPIQFAFSNKQFAEGMAALGLDVTETEKICSVPGGGFMRKTDAKQLGDMFLRHNREMDSAIAGDETGEGFILEMFDYELSNHEYCITWDTEPTLRALGLTEDEVKASPALSYGLALARKAQWEDTTE